MRRIAYGLGALLAAACSTPDSTGPDQNVGPSFSAGVPEAAGAVFVATNGAVGNEVLVFPRGGDGGLGAPQSYPTGGLGTGAGLGNQGGLALSPNGANLYVVNAGSDDVSGFRLTAGGLEHLGTWPSGGNLPISIALHGDLLYVLNDGGTANVTGFRIANGGSLTPIPGSTRTLSEAAPDAGQVGFSPDGARLVVTEKGTNLLTTFPVLGDGSLGAAVSTASAGQTPFGFAFDGRGTLVVSEAFGGAAGASTVSSYRPSGAAWAAVSPAAPTTETAACWIAVSPNGRFAYSTNTGSNSVSGFAIGLDGSLALLNPDGVTGTTGVRPIDMSFSRNGRYLYTLNAGGPSISAFRVGADGSLEPLAGAGALPVGSNGLVAN